MAEGNPKIPILQKKTFISPINMQKLKANYKQRLA